MTEQELLRHCLKDNIEAITLCSKLAQVCQVWDDLIDKDKVVPPEVINEVFWMVLIDIPCNSFYRTHFAQLVTIIGAIINDWLDSNTLEKGSKNEKILAYVLRDRASMLITTCAEIIGGYHWMRQISPIVTAFIYDEPISEYLEG